MAIKRIMDDPTLPGIQEARENLLNCTIKDSGTRREFDTGAVRDIQEGKGRCDLMPLDVLAEHMEDSILLFIYQFTTNGNPGHLYRVLDESPGRLHLGDRPTVYLEVAKHFEEGAKKYGENNWQKGLPVSCYIDSAVRHYLKYLRGDTDEPHDRAFCWNIMCAIWTCRHKPELNSYSTKPVTPNENLCVCCGTPIPEGRQVCPKCMDDGK
jgi:hypothetical protein